ncbi:MAG: endolytic transglycosylase MltG [Thermodesulfobacteriota bacterium]
MKHIKPLIISAIIFAILTSSFFYYSFYFERFSKQEINVDIPRGYGLNLIANLLEKNEVVRNKKLFIAYALINGSGNKLKAGEYFFDPSITIKEVFDKLENGDVIIRKVTIPEGLNINEIGKILEKNKVVSKNDFVALAASEEFSENFFQISTRNLEGFLFPDTYSFNKNESPKFVIETMVNRFKEVFEKLENSRGYDLLETVTRASIIEKETGVNSEKPLVSAVIDNRLKKGIRLACDPTVIYALGEKFNGNLTKKDLEFESPYNTYRVKGLPPGPIANPGKESLEAALNPADVDYLYFVSKGDGSHFFSDNYNSHVNAVNKYIKSKK